MSLTSRVAACFCTIAASLVFAGVSYAADDAASAAKTALSQHGGRVLKVERRADGYRVKLLQDSGKVKIVFIPAPKGKRANGHRMESARRRIQIFPPRQNRAAR